MRKMNIRLRYDVDRDGSQVTKSKTFSGVNLEAADSDILSFAEAAEDLIGRVPEVIKVEETVLA